MKRETILLQRGDRKFTLSPKTCFKCKKKFFLRDKLYFIAATPINIFYNKPLVREIPGWNHDWVEGCREHARWTEKANVAFFSQDYSLIKEDGHPGRLCHPKNEVFLCLYCNQYYYSDYQNEDTLQCNACSRKFWVRCKSCGTWFPSQPYGTNGRGRYGEWQHEYENCMECVLKGCENCGNEWRAKGSVLQKSATGIACAHCLSSWAYARCKFCGQPFKRSSEHRRFCEKHKGPNKLPDVRSTLSPQLFKEVFHGSPEGKNLSLTRHKKALRRTRRA